MGQSAWKTSASDLDVLDRRTWQRLKNYGRLLPAATSDVPSILAYAGSGKARQAGHLPSGGGRRRGARLVNSDETSNLPRYVYL
jgi:hypothetical protein